MLPEFLQGSYVRYKTDTNAFATWLLETANQCGYQPPELSAAISIVKTAKHKCKYNESDATPFHCSATTKDLQKLAEVVASSTIAVPKSVITIAKRANSIEKECHFLVLEPRRLCEQ